MRGAELPVNMLIIIILALITLAAIAVLFYSGWLPATRGIDLETAKNNACQAFQAQGCIDCDKIKVNYDVKHDGNKNNDNLKELAKEYYNTDCHTLCNC
ncbi:MAG: hypothetical protein QW751_01680 [Candidatus Aenigmatarchaeota archaeon]|nr:hypothetical protein [Candidatus Aenigmarchaeota archaeon]